MEAKALLCDVAPDRRLSRLDGPRTPGMTARNDMDAQLTCSRTNQARHTYVAEGRASGFFTDPTVCIGCKACEVACKEWNNVPEDGLAWTGTLLRQLRQPRRVHLEPREVPRAGSAARAQVAGAQSTRPVAPEDPFGWLFLSDVCKHCEHAGCLEACPTGAIFRTEVSSVYVQDDVCNGCGYCVVGCPFGVIDRRPARCGCGRRVQMHVLLRPADRRAHTGVREGVSDRVDPVRTARRASRARRATGRRSSAHAASPMRTSTTRSTLRSAASTPSSCCR